MEVSIYEAKARLSELIEVAESGREVVLARRHKPVARIVPVGRGGTTRIGGLAGRTYRMGEDFDNPAAGEALADAFGVARS